MKHSISNPSRKPIRSATAVASAGTRAGLAREQLVDAALALLQEAGLDALSTRRLAERLGVKSPALYWYVQDKNELLGLVADAICGGMVLPATDCPFRSRLEAIAWEYRRVLLSHRDAHRLFVEQAPTGPNRIKLYDAAVGAFLDAGFPAPEAVAMATFYRHYLLGMIAEEARQAYAATPGTLPPARALGVELSDLGDQSTRYPNLKGTAEFLVNTDPQVLFRIGLKVLLDGMECRVREIVTSNTATPARARPGVKRH